MLKNAQTTKTNKIAFKCDGKGLHKQKRGFNLGYRLHYSLGDRFLVTFSCEV